MMETELKLHIAPEHLAKLGHHPLLRTLSVGRAQTRTLYSIYYDTAKLDLRQQAMALRLRRVGRQCIQTLKGGGQVSAGLHQRSEWETPVPGEQLDFDALKACGGKLPHGVRNHLQPVFVTDFTRTVRLLDFEGAQIELCLDSGDIRAGKSSCPISELELELKSGSPGQLFKLALALLDIVPLEVEQTSKAEYGYLLFAAVRQSPSKADLPVFSASARLEDALKQLVAACLAHIQANLSGALLGLDEEYLHQVRVGLRRLRVGISLLLRYHADAELAALRVEVAELSRELGRVREWDVFVTQTLAPICSRFPEHAGLKQLLRASETERKRYHKEMHGRLVSRDFQRLLLRFGAWRHSDETISGQHGEIVPFIEKTLKKWHTRADKLGRTLPDMAKDALLLHRMRILCKKLRYGSEMFGGLFHPAQSRHHLEALAELQDVLGKLNDIAVARRILETLDDKTRHEAVMLVRGWIERDHAVQAALSRGAWNHYSEQARA